jgi:tRNA(fMet)-specific endonuclease VapC
MIRITLDTNRYSDLQRGAPGVVEALSIVDAIVVTFVVVAELRAGFILGRRGAENERLLQAFLALPDVTIAFPDVQTTHSYAKLHRQLRQQGTPIPDNDLWLAALAVQHDLIVYSRDTHFDYLPQLKRL